MTMVTSRDALSRRNAFTFALAVRRTADFYIRTGRTRLVLLTAAAAAFAVGGAAWWAWVVLAIAYFGSWQGWSLQRAVLAEREPRNLLIVLAYRSAVGGHGRHMANIPGAIEGISCLTLALAAAHGLHRADAALVAFAFVMGYAVSVFSAVFLDNANYNPNDAPFFGFEFLRQWVGPLLALLAAAAVLPGWPGHSIAPPALVCGAGVLASLRVRETDRVFIDAYAQARESERLVGRDDVLNQTHGLSTYLDRALTLGAAMRADHPDVYGYVQAALVALQQLTELEDPYVDAVDYPATLVHAVRRFARAYGAWESTDIRVPQVSEPDHRLARILVHDLVGNAGKAGASRIGVLFEHIDEATVSFRVEDDASPFPRGAWMAEGSSLARLGRTLAERSGRLRLNESGDSKAVTATWRLQGTELNCGDVGAGAGAG